MAAISFLPFHRDKGIAFGQGLFSFLDFRTCGLADTAAKQPTDDADMTNSLAVTF